MSDARKCDRCGQYFGTNEYYRDPDIKTHLFDTFDRVRIYRSRSCITAKERYYDICPKCQEELWKWLNMSNKPATADAISDGYHTFGEHRDKLFDAISDGYQTFGELYEHRDKLFAVIVNEHKDISWKSRRHSDGEQVFGWFIVGIETPEGQYAYHVKDTPENWSMFHVEDRKKAKKYDGHKPKDIERLFSLESVDGIAQELRRKGDLFR